MGLEKRLIWRAPLVDQAVFLRTRELAAKQVEQQDTHIGMGYPMLVMRPDL